MAELGPSQCLLCLVLHWLSSAARYEAGAVTEPLVAFELQAIWPRRESKVRRVF